MERADDPRPRTFDHRGEGRRIKVLLDVDVCEGSGADQPIDERSPVALLPGKPSAVTTASNRQDDGTVDVPGEAARQLRLPSAQVIHAQLKEIDPAAIARGQPKVRLDGIGCQAKTQRGAPLQKSLR